MLDIVTVLKLLLYVLLWTRSHYGEIDLNVDGDINGDITVHDAAVTLFTAC